MSTRSWNMKHAVLWHSISYWPLLLLFHLKPIEVGWRRRKSRRARGAFWSHFVDFHSSLRCCTSSDFSRELWARVFSWRLLYCKYPTLETPLLLLTKLFILVWFIENLLENKTNSSLKVSKNSMRCRSESGKRSRNERQDSHGCGWECVKHLSPPSSHTLALLRIAENKKSCKTHLKCISNLQKTTCCTIEILASLEISWKSTCC